MSIENFEAQKTAEDISAREALQKDANADRQKDPGRQRDPGSVNCLPDWGDSRPINCLPSDVIPLISIDMFPNQTNKKA